VAGKAEHTASCEVQCIQLVNALRVLAGKLHGRRITYTHSLPRPHLLVLDLSAELEPSAEAQHNVLSAAPNAPDIPPLLWWHNYRSAAVTRNVCVEHGLQAYLVVLPEEQVHAALADLRGCEAWLTAARAWFPCKQ
jgi:hypothetical protein